MNCTKTCPKNLNHKSYLRNKKASSFIATLKNLSSKLISHLTNVIKAIQILVS